MGLGFRVFPLKRGAKKPAVRSWQSEATSDIARIREWDRDFPACNWGAAMGAGTFALDIDTKHGRPGFKTLRELKARHGALPVTLTNITPHNGQHRIFKFSGSIKNSVDQLGEGLDIRGDGGFIVIPPSVVDGRKYVWEDPAAAIAEAPEWLVAFLAESPSRARPGLVPEGRRNDTVFRESCRLRALNTPRDEARTRLHAFNKSFCSPVLDAAEVERCLESAWRYPAGYQPNDRGNAQRFVNTYGEDVRYVIETGDFIYWDKHHWRVDTDDLRVLLLMKESNRQLFDEARDCEDEARRKSLARCAVYSQNTPRIKQAVESVKSEVGIAVLASELNVNPLLLGVGNGVIDLKRGRCRPGRREDLITSRAGCEYNADAKCPTWRTFLSRVLNGNRELIDYVQCLVGYTLTGLTHEQLLLFAYGLGANGKTVFFETLRALLGDYARTLRTEAIMARVSGSRGGASEDEARLAGARFVQANETSQGMRFNDALIKDLTGGDTITARRLYEKSFEYRPQFKLWIRGNHKPILHGSDGGIARRVKLIPFEVHIPPLERDPLLLDKLKAELPGILNWAIEGCLKWQQDGLQEPTVVQRATAEYLAEMDPIGCFLGDCCVVDASAKDSVENLHRAYSTWSTTTGARPLSAQQLSQRLAGRGFKPFRSRTLAREGRVTRGLRGIRVASESEV